MPEHHPQQPIRQRSQPPAGHFPQDDGAASGAASPGAPAPSQHPAQFHGRPEGFQDAGGDFAFRRRQNQRGHSPGHQRRRTQNHGARLQHDDRGPRQARHPARPQVFRPRHHHRRDEDFRRRPCQARAPGPWLPHQPQPHKPHAAGWPQEKRRGARLHLPQRLVNGRHQRLHVRHLFKRKQRRHGGPHPQDPRPGGAP